MPKKGELRQAIMVQKVLEIAQKEPTLSQREIASKLGISEATVQRYLSSPAAKALQSKIQEKMMSILEVSTANILEQVKNEKETLENGGQIDSKSISWQASKDFSSKLDVAVPKTEHVTRNEKSLEEIMKELEDNK